jgi:hypothetical protein
MRGSLRALVWLGFACGLLLAGFAVFWAAVLAPVAIVRRELPGPVLREVLAGLYSLLLLQALLPELLLTFATWLVVARVAPAFDRSRGALALGLLAVGALWFPMVGHYWFRDWSPTVPSDYVFALLFVTGAPVAALWIPRVASPVLAPGCFEAGARRGRVDE